MISIEEMIKTNPEMMTLLAIIKSFQLPDSWLCAGTLRNFVWNHLSGKKEVFTSDIDLVFFDPNRSYEETLELERRIKADYPSYNWEVKNEVYMNVHTPDMPVYENSRDAIRKFPERCTAIAARLNQENDLELYLPYGSEDILQFKVLPTPYYAKNSARRAIYRKRLATKNWKRDWPQLIIVE